MEEDRHEFVFRIGFLLLVLPGRHCADQSQSVYGTPSLSQVVFPSACSPACLAVTAQHEGQTSPADRSTSCDGDVQFGFTGGPQTVHARISGAD
jgi:hypothetical protein